MKILQINTVYKEKSTGRTCYEVEQELNRLGHKCVTAYGVGKHKKSTNIYKIDTRIEYEMHNILSRVTGLEGFFSIFATIRLIKFIKKFSPDVIHLRNLHGHYLNLPILFRFLKKNDYPIVQNLHDMWAITGKCCYYTSYNCDKWQVGCCQCPAKKKYPISYFFDFSRFMWKKKKEWYSRLKNLSIVGVSKWVSEEAEKSYLKQCKSISYIYNWVNMDIFKPSYIFEETKKKYNIPNNKKVILGVSAFWSEGTPRVVDFKKLATILKDDEVIVMVGRKDCVLPDGVIHIPFTSSTQELALLYSMATVYVHCSIEDTFGKVIAEAQACGTPAIVYDSTGCKEIVVDGISGYVVEPRNVDRIREKIDLIKLNGKEAYINNCVENVMNRFSYKKNMVQLIEVYNNVCK